ncbi:MAG: hypothetical protein ACI8UO_006391 [Verrucomicrobiales bacterium]|jgi:hypothetical protein
MKSRKRRVLLILIVLALLFGAGILGWLESSSTPWFRSATAMEPDPDPRTMVMVFEAGIWRGGLRPFEDFPEPDKDLVFDLGHGNQIEVVAISIVQPGAVKPGRWLDPRSFEEITREQLLEMGSGELDDGPLSPFTPFSSKESPVLTLLLRSSGAPGFTAHAASANAFDARTHAEISYEGTHFPTFSESNLDEWTRLGFSLGIWHDTPVDLGIVWRCGMPKVAELHEKKAGYWETNSDATKASVIDPHRIKEIVTGEETDGNEMVPTIEIGSMTHYMQPGAWLSQIELLDAQDPKSWGLQLPDSRDSSRMKTSWFTPTSGLNGLYHFRTDFSEEPTSMRLVHLPEMTPTRIRIDRLPGMPNGRDLANLFDARIPYLESYNELYAAGRAVELEITTATPLSRAHPAYDLMRTMRHESSSLLEDMTVSEILIKLSESPPFPRFRVDHENHNLVIEVGEQTRWERMKSWWNERTPEWIQFDESP